MASADFLQFVITALCFEYLYSSASARSPRVSSITFASRICCIYAPEFGQYWTSFCLGNSSVPSTPYMQFLFVRPRFCPRVSILPTSGFLQIPPRDGHPCLRLTVPTAKSVADFHRQVIAHAERTKKTPLLPNIGLKVFPYLVFCFCFIYASLTSISFSNSRLSSGELSPAVLRLTRF